LGPPTKIYSFLERAFDDAFFVWWERRRRRRRANCSAEFQAVLS
jgi:hypothetical protein